MWCANCKADVAAEVSTDNRRVHCATCRTELSVSPLSAQSSRTREAREILQRWSNSQLLDPFGPISTNRPANESPSTSAHPSTPQEKPVASSQPKPKFRIDSAHSASSDSERSEPQAEHSRSNFDEGQSSSSEVDRQEARRDSAEDSSPTENSHRIERRAEAERQFRERYRHDPSSMRSRPHDDEDEADDFFDDAPRRRSRRKPIAQRAERGAERLLRVHASHSEEPPAPHFDLKAALQEKENERTNWSTVAGQFLAYGGVLGLTIGTALVLLGYFGGADHLTPTGWLVTTAGQMLLFLGVVTLVSGGMEQTSEAVSRRIEVLGEYILRIEQASRDHALRGPSIPPEYFADGSGEHEFEDHSRRRSRSDYSSD